MKTLKHYVEACADAGFDAAHPQGFLLYNRADGPLASVDVSSGETLGFRPAPRSAQTPASRLEMFEVFEFPASEGEIIIGSDDACEVVVNDESISRRHAKAFVRAGRALEVTDLASTLGTQVGGRTLSEGESATVKPGDVVTLGSIGLRWLTAERFRLLVSQMAPADR